MEDEMIFAYNGGHSMMKFFDGEDGITVELPDEGDEGLTGTFTDVEELCYALAPVVTFIPEKYTLAGMLSMWFGGDEEEIFDWLMK